MTEYEIVDEPPERGGRGGEPWVDAFAEWLKQHPGKWAIAPRTWAPSNTASYYMTRLQAQGCEAVTRVVNNRRTIYARYPE